MISFSISAPGKVILFGEHSVVYGKTAVAASLDLRSTLKFAELSSDDVVEILMPRLELSRRIPASQVRDSLLAADFPRLSIQGHEKFLRAVQKFVQTLDCAGEPRCKISLECFFYALAQVAQDESLEIRGFRLELDTQLSIGAGAGSSASFAVCLVAGFTRWSHLQRDPAAEPVFDDASLERISAYALNCEKIMHGAPSGIDNCVCTFGSVIEFRKGEAPRFIPKNLASLRILLVDTKVGRSTKTLVDRLAGLVQRYPEIFHRVLESMDEVSKRVIQIFKQTQELRSGDSDSRLLELLKELSVLVDINQGLLATCQVSHSTLDLICLTAKRYGYSAKLTGAGGGGFAYVLIPPDATDGDVEKLSSELTASGFSVIETNLGGSGIQIHDGWTE